MLVTTKPVAPPVRATAAARPAVQAKAVAAPAKRPARDPVAEKKEWGKFCGAAALTLAGWGVNAVGVMGAGRLPYLGFVGLFLGGVAIMGAGIRMAYHASEHLRELRFGK